MTSFMDFVTSEYRNMWGFWVGKTMHMYKLFTIYFLAHINLPSLVLHSNLDLCNDHQLTLISYELYQTFYLCLLW